MNQDRFLSSCNIDRIEYLNDQQRNQPVSSTIELTKNSGNQRINSFSFCQNENIDDSKMLSGASRRRELLQIIDQSLILRNSMDDQDNVIDIENSNNQSKDQESSNKNDIDSQFKLCDIEELKSNRKRLNKHRQRSMSKYSNNSKEDLKSKKLIKKLSIYSIRFKNQASPQQLQNQQSNSNKIDLENDDVVQPDEIQEKKQRNYFQILYFIVKFSLFIKELNTTKRFKQLQEKHFNIINDITHFITQKSFCQNLICKAIYNLLQNILECLDNCIPIFSTEYFIVVLWDCIFTLSLFCQFLYIPFQLVFQTYVENTINQQYYLISLIIFIIDFFITFNISYYAKGSIVTSRKEIAKNYLKGDFFINFISTLAYLILYITNTQWFCLFTLLRINQFTTRINKIDEHFNLSQRYSTIFELSKLVTTLVLVTQWFACGFAEIAIIEEQFGATMTWMIKQDIHLENWIVKYINSLYFSLITMITVGYGDITPVTFVEKVFIMVMTLISCGVFAYIVNTVGQIFREISLKQAAFKKKKYDLIQYMNIRKICKQTQIKMIRYLEYQNDQQQKGHQQGEAILKDISKNISEELYIEYFGKILREHKVFKLNFSDDCLNGIALIMKEITVGPGELIYKQDEITNKIFFLLEGKIEYFLYSKNKNNKNTSLSIEKNPRMIGMKAFFSNQKSQLSCKSVNISRLAFISKDDFTKLLKDYPDDYEVFCKLRENIIANNRVFDQQCLSCNLFTHSIRQCPMVNLKINRHLIINRYNNQNSFNQQRQPYQRKDQIYYSSIVDKPLISLDLKKIRHDIIQIYLGHQPNYNITEIKDDKQFYLTMPKVDVINNENIKIIEECDELEKVYLQSEVEVQSQFNFREQPEEECSSYVSPGLKKSEIELKQSSPTRIKRRSSRMGSLKSALDANQIKERLASRGINIFENVNNKQQATQSSQPQPLQQQQQQQQSQVQMQQHQQKGSPTQQLQHFNQRLSKQSISKQISQINNDAKSQVTMKTMSVDDINTFLQKFDKMKSYSKFFPYNNVEFVLTDYEIKKQAYLNKIQRKTPRRKPFRPNSLLNISQQSRKSIKNFSNKEIFDKQSEKQFDNNLIPEQEHE